MKPAITVVDYGVSNLFSVIRALEYCGAEVQLATQPQQVLHAQRLLLPGVGAFAKGMTGLASLNLIQPLKDFAKTGRPFLGICLGMQMMLDASEEFGEHPGLGMIPGRVTLIPKAGFNGIKHKVPHVGWNDITALNQNWNDTILENLPQPSSVYFVHSYTAFPINDSHRLADADYDGCRISAVIKSGSLYGCQFHPEKSGEVGLAIIKNFLQLPV